MTTIRGGRDPKGYYHLIFLGFALSRLSVLFTRERKEIEKRHFGGYLLVCAIVTEAYLRIKHFLCQNQILECSRFRLAKSTRNGSEKGGKNANS